MQNDVALDNCEPGSYITVVGKTDLAGNPIKVYLKYPKHEKCIICDKIKDGKYIETDGVFICNQCMEEIGGWPMEEKGG